jgi:outer membrane immunogenic protein
VPENRTMKKFLLAGVAAIALASGAQAADLGVPRGAVAGVVMAPVFSWTGFYLGAHVGFTSGSTTFTDTGLGGSGAVWNALNDRFTANRSGIVAGGQIGYNYQINNIVLGLEADLGYLGGSGSRASALSADTIGQVQGGIYGTFRGRAGIAVDRVLLFVTGGVIGADTGARINDTVGATLTTNRTGFRAGWTVGGGLEFAATQNWTIKADYLYYDLGRQSVSGQRNGVAGPAENYAFGTRSTGHIVRVGVNYLFSTGPSAVVARY